MTNPTNGNALAKRSPQTLTRARYEPQSFDDAQRMARMLVVSELIPDHLRARGEADLPRAMSNIMTIMIQGNELGLTTMQSLQNINVIKGKPTLSAALMVALCKRSPECVYFRAVEVTTEKATFATLRQGAPEPTTYTYTIADAEAARLTGNQTWSKFRKAMLVARCSSALARMEYPDLVAGIYTPDEIGGDPAALDIEVEVVDVKPQTFTESNLETGLAASPPDIKERIAKSDAPTNDPKAREGYLVILKGILAEIDPRKHEKVIAPHCPVGVQPKDVLSGAASSSAIQQVVERFGGSPATA